MIFLDDLFEMNGGYVLNFKDLTFSQFFAREIGCNIDHSDYAESGRSKAKRLRCFLHKVDASTAVETLNALWEYREAVRLHDGRAESIENARGRFLSLISRLEGKPEVDAGQPMRSQPRNAFDRSKLLSLRTELIGLMQISPQTRGYAFETLLRDLFNLFGLEGREPFRLKGEQIDGSFVLQGEIYLVEAKWQAAPTGVADLHTFHGKLEQKAAWARGLFVSNSGFTEEGLTAFGRGKRVICMDGLDLFETLNRELPLNEVLDRKVRRAAETGQPFSRVRDIFPS